MGLFEGLSWQMRFRTGFGYWMVIGLKAEKGSIGLWFVWALMGLRIYKII